MFRLGVVVVASGLVVDLAYHAAGVGGTAGEVAGHLVTLVGMLITLADLGRAARRSRLLNPGRRPVLQPVLEPVHPRREH
jgi:hypothetical protein